MVGRNGKHGSHTGLTARLRFVGLACVAALLLPTACAQKTTQTKNRSREFSISGPELAERAAETESPEYRALSDQERVGVIGQMAEKQGGFDKQHLMLLTPVAERGNAEAQYVMAMVLCYPEWRKQGSGISQDKTAAHAWFLKAAKQGHSYAAAEAAKDFFYGDGTTQDHDQALRWYEAAAQANHPHAQCMASKLYMQRFVKSGNTQELSKSINWLQKAVDNGDEEAKGMFELFRKTGVLQMLRAADNGQEEGKRALEALSSYIKAQDNMTKTP
jgi:TPR repeat protein